MTKEQTNQLLELALTHPGIRTAPILNPVEPPQPRPEITRNSLNRSKVKLLIRKGDWETLGRVFEFVPVFMQLPGGRLVIDWRCVPLELNYLLYGKSQREGVIYTGRFVSPTHREVLYARQNGRCHYCAGQIDFKVWTIDHVIPLCRGGKNQLKNKVGCCKRCNGVKGPLTEDEFRDTGYVDCLLGFKQDSHNIAARELKLKVTEINNQIQAKINANKIKLHLL